MATSPNLGWTMLTEGQGQAEITANTAMEIIESGAQLFSVTNRTTATPPGSPSEGALYLVATSPTGAWTGWAGRLAIYINGLWYSMTPKEGWRVWVKNEDLETFYDGSAWLDIPRIPYKAAIVASTTQTQGQGALTKGFNRVSTCANANDTVTLPTAAPGSWVVVANDGAQTLQVFPASGDSIDAGAANASTTIATTKRRLFFTADSTIWSSILGA